MDLFSYIVGGAVVGFSIGLTGVGGGSLMTPLLVFYGVPLRMAIGTDLLYAAVTKIGGVIAHQYKGTIHWRITGLLAAGSLPASVCTAFTLQYLYRDSEAYTHLMGLSLGAMLVSTSLLLVLRGRLQNMRLFSAAPMGTFTVRHQAFATVLAGVLLGIFVTLSSVGAGVIGTMALLMMYPRLSPVEVVGTELAHAVPLSLVAGIGHWVLLGNVRWLLLAGLLVGSLPAVFLGTQLSTAIPQTLLRYILAGMLCFLGLRFIFFPN